MRNMEIVPDLGHLFVWRIDKVENSHLKPLARISSVSADGDTVPFAMRLIVDLDMPVIIETCRVDRFLFSMILSSNIFILQL